MKLDRATADLQPPGSHISERQIILYRSVCDYAYRSPGCVCLLFYLQIHQFKPSQGILTIILIDYLLQLIHKLMITLYIRPLQLYIQENNEFSSCLEARCEFCTPSSLVFVLQGRSCVRCNIFSSESAHPPYCERSYSIFL